jgi:selenocysteine lyase/cysteine desulfurase
MDALAWVRAVELRRLEQLGAIYLDYGGAAPYPDSLVRRHGLQLRGRTLGNPHSTNPAARAATEDVSAAKHDILRFFDADPAIYDVGLVANCSAGIRLVGESFPWDATSVFALTADNHNSVNGVRQFARARGSRVQYLPLDARLRVPRLELPRLNGARGLFAFPAQSNFSGVRHALEFVTEAQRRGYMVLLDAAAYAPTSPLSLRAVPADFVPVSFYKMFGYPAGIGALIARRESLQLLRRPWFAGGTVDFASVAHDRHQLKTDLEAFEDGTVNFLAASAVSLGLDFMEHIGPDRVNAHVAALTEHLLSWLDALRHCNGRPLIRVYGPRDTDRRGGTVAFDVIDHNGRALDCELIVELAGKSGISLRSGCFCNPGAAEYALGAETTALRRGALRASLGYGSNYADVDALGSFLSQFNTGDLS